MRSRFAKWFDIRLLYYGESSGYPLRRKIGIDGTGQRWRYIDEEIKGSKERCTFRMLIPFCYLSEQILLKVTLPLKAKMPKHSGFTEWRYIGFADWLFEGIYFIFFLHNWTWVLVICFWFIMLLLYPFGIDLLSILNNQIK